MALVTPNQLTNPTVERSLIGILLMDPDAYMRVSDRLRPEYFSTWQHTAIYNAIAATALARRVDIVSVADMLEAKGQLASVGGSAYLADTINAVADFTYLEQHADKVRNLYLRREMIGVASGIAQDAHDMGLDIIDVQANAQSALLDIASSTEHSKIVPAAQLADDLLTRVGAFMSGQAEWNTVPTGLVPLDVCFAGGLEPGVYIVAGRPAIGKSALLLQIAANIAMRGERVMIFSIEMSNREVGLRLASGLARVPLRTIKSGNTTAEQNAAVMGALGQISEWPLHLIDQSQLRASDVLLMAQRVALEYKDLAAIFVDGLWLMTPEQKFSNRVQEIGSISKGIKQAQRHLDVPIVITHQLSRNPEHRNDKRPLLSDLRESGDCEQDSDVVLMLYREGYYDMNADDVAELWIRKNRLGGESNERVKMLWVQNIGRFERLSYDEEPRGE